MRRLVLLSSALLGLAIPAIADTYVVDPEGTGDFPTIQAAISAAANGDIIELTDGTFTGDGNRDMGFMGKAITVRSQSGTPESCIIDCQGGAEPHRGFFFTSGEGPASRLEGVTITNGSISSGGAGMTCNYASSPTIANCILIANVAGTGLGGGLFCGLSSSPEFQGCAFVSNEAFHGGAIFCGAASPTFTRCTFAHNQAVTGGAIYCEGYATDGPTLINCTLYGNSAPMGAGIHGSYYDPRVTLTNTVIAFNHGDAIMCDGSLFTLVCCDLYGNEGADWGCVADQYGVNGNISEDPLFCDPENDDFTLECTSPCAPFSPPNPECDLIGAWPVGCGETPAVETTWGALRILFHR